MWIGASTKCQSTGGLSEYNRQGQYWGAFRGVRFGALIRVNHLMASMHIVSGLDHLQHVVREVGVHTKDEQRLPPSAITDGRRQPRPRPVGGASAAAHRGIARPTPLARSGGGP
jgi:hypothetical protein